MMTPANSFDALGLVVHIEDMNAAKKTDYSAEGVFVAGITSDAAGTDTVTYLHNDHLGSTATGTNQSGTVLWTQRFTPYGEELNSVVANDNQAGFTGHIKDAATGLNYMQARYDDPVMGRFLQTDPIGFADQMNLYAYVHNDPMNAIDPTGEFANFVAKFVIDVGLEVAIQVASGQEVDLGSATKGAALGLLDPTKTARKVAKLGKLANTVRKANKTCCFVAGTLVGTEDGLRSTENIEVGDLVWARDEETGEEALKPVLGLIRFHDRVIWDLETVSETGEAHTFGTTDDHPWWVDGHGWKRTDELSPKDILVTPTGEKVSVLSVSNTNIIEPTFNFEVADFNTYFVGESKVWVHNAACDVFRSKRRAARSAQRGHGTPTSRSGEQVQGRSGEPRHQIKEGADGQPVGVVDGSRDAGHGPHVEVGNAKVDDAGNVRTNQHGQPRISNDKVKEDF